MNVQTHLNGQIAGQVPNQAVSQIPPLTQYHGLMTPNQMHNLGAVGPDMDWDTLRRKMQIKILSHLQGSTIPADIRTKLPEFSRRFEELIFKECQNNKEEYCAQLRGDIARRLSAIVRNQRNQAQNNQQFRGQSVGIPVSASSNYSGSTMIPTPGMAQNASRSSGGLVEDAAGGSTGLTSGGAQHHSSSLVQSQGMRRQMPQMIPTPGFSSQQMPSRNSEDQVHLVGQSSGGLMNVPNIQVANRTPASAGYMSMPAYSGSTRPIQQQFNRQLPQQRTTTSILQQGLPVVADRSATTKPVDGSGSGSFYGSGPSVSTPGNLQSDVRVNPSFGSQQPSMQSIQPQLKPDMLDRRENTNFQSLQTNYEQLHSQQLLAPHQQPPNQQHPQLMQNPQQVNRQHQPMMRNSADHVLSTNNRVGSAKIVKHEPPDIQGEYQLKDSRDDSKGVFVPGPSHPAPNFHMSAYIHQSSELSNRSPNNFSSFPAGSKADQNLQSKLGVCLPHNHQTVAPGEAAQQTVISSEGHVMPNLRTGAKGTHTAEEIQNALLKSVFFVRHARSCTSLPGTCALPSCSRFREFAHHIDSCGAADCPRTNCLIMRRVLTHIRHCRDDKCQVCIRTSTRFAQNTKSEHMMIDKQNSGLEPIKSLEENQSTMLCDAPPTQPEKEGLAATAKEDQCEVFDRMNKTLSSAMDIDVPATLPMQPMPRKPNLVENMSNGVKSEVVSTILDNDTLHAMPETAPTLQREIVENKPPVNMQVDVTHADSSTAGKSGKAKIKGVSMTELFTPEQIRDHIRSLRQWVGQSKSKAEKNQAMESTMNENSCQLCAVEKLSFEPPPIYCSPCGARIKRNAFYYTIATGETRHYFCILCYNDARGDTIEAEGLPFQKAKLEKKRNDVETEESWVQCDKCEAWQHQICALFNGRRDDGGQAEYTCPNCYLKEIESGEHIPLPQSAVLGAKDLPRTILSDHIEQRLFKRLKQERQERASHFGKPFDEVPGVEGLVVRVVSSVDKRLEVKPRFLEIFQEENYPTEFPYKSKAVLLFQRIEGVEVCLFGMYVQEFGSECAFPNRRRVYLSYLDSVKYFRPEIKTVHGEALRTFVYHEILIGYLEYCKKRGFTSCYIWACPPLKGEDYILYCHPEIQKTPKSDKLREWYLAMLRKASKETIVAEITNLYDHFFTKAGECKAKVTASRLPYFDGDYWPGAAEDMISLLNKDDEDNKMQSKKFRPPKKITKRTLKAAGYIDSSGNVSKDLMLMKKLGETIYPMKEDFIMVHLQHACTYCCILMVSGSRWVCNKCKNFQLCDACHGLEQRTVESDRHGATSREKHMLYPVEISDVPEDTKDKDDILESEFFDTRQAFLSLCQGNHYQYDTLRRAKHSSMMVLYHLHNPTAPAFVITCNVCHLDIEAGQGWRCEVCPDFDVCTACYEKEGRVNHPHRLTHHPSLAERNAQNKEARQQRVLQLRTMLDLLVHASQCRVPYCIYPNCRKVKALFRHGIQCKIRASGGCALCKRMWYLLQLHSRACKEPQCHVPRCRDLKDHLRRSQQQSDSRRRAAVMEMMRQRAAEVSSSTQ